MVTPLARKLDLVIDTHVEGGFYLLERVAGQNKLVFQTTLDAEEEVEVLLVNRQDL